MAFVVLGQMRLFPRSHKFVNTSYCITIFVYRTTSQVLLQLCNQQRTDNCECIDRQTDKIASGKVTLNFPKKNIYILCGAYVIFYFFFHSSSSSSSFAIYGLCCVCVCVWVCKKGKGHDKWDMSTDVLHPVASSQFYTVMCGSRWVHFHHYFPCTGTAILFVFSGCGSGVP